MTDSRQQIREEIATLFNTQLVAVLSTQKNNQPYASLVAFAASPDLEHIYFLTPNTTRKYENLIANPQIAILVNNSRNQADDIYNAVSVTGTGVAADVEKDANREALDMYLAKHPHLKDFVKAPTTAFIRVTMNRYFMVNRFQHVVELRVTV